VPEILEAIFRVLISAYRLVERVGDNVVHAWDVVISALWLTVRVAFFVAFLVVAQLKTIQVVLACLFPQTFEFPDAFEPLVPLVRSLPIVSAFLALAVGETVVIVTAFFILHALLTFRLFQSGEDSSDQFRPFDDDQADDADPLHF
jgi:hypothetical protein